MINDEKVCYNKLSDGTCMFKGMGVKPGNKTSYLKCIHWNSGGLCYAPSAQKEILHKSNDPMELGLVTTACQNVGKYHVIQLATGAQDFLDIFYEVELKDEPTEKLKKHFQNLINSSLKWAQEE